MSYPFNFSVDPLLLNSLRGMSSHRDSNFFFCEIGVIDNLHMSSKKIGGFSWGKKKDSQ